MRSDGGHVCLDWFNEKTDEQPTVLMLPGITGMTSLKQIYTHKKVPTVIAFLTNDTSFNDYRQALIHVLGLVSFEQFFTESFIGSSEDNYIRHWVENMTELGYRYVCPSPL